MYTVSLHAKAEFWTLFPPCILPHCRVYRFSCSSPVHPPAEFEYEFQSGQLKMLDSQTAPAAASYECNRVMVTSDDGTQVPLTILSSAAEPHLQQQQQRQSPLLLHAYGAYGHVLDLSFDPNLQTLLDRGWRVRAASVAAIFSSQLGLKGIRAPCHLRCMLLLKATGQHTILGGLTPSHPFLHPLPDWHRLHSLT